MDSKCVIYARVSTKAQAEDELPIEGQIQECRQFAQSRGWEVVKVFQDAGYSGGTLDRPAFQEMYNGAREKTLKYDIVLSWRSNRLFRDVEARLAYSRLFKRYSIRLISLHEPEYEGASGRLAETIFGAIDEYYRSQTSEDTLRGLKMIARRGYSTGGIPPTGYRNIRAATGKIKPNGEPEMRTKWEIDPITAVKVKTAFEMCATGKTSVDIVNATGIVSAKNGLSTLLRNRAYIGERIYNTTRRASLSDKKTRRIKNDPESYVVVRDSHPAIISIDLFNRVQDILTSRRPAAGRRVMSPRCYILSGLLWCVEHESFYSGHTNGTNYYYACGMRKKLGKKHAACPWIKKDIIEKYVIDQLKRKIFTRSVIKNSLQSLREEQARNRQEDDAILTDAEKQLTQTETELQNLYKALATGKYREGALDQPINERLDIASKLKTRIAEIKRDMERAMRIPEVTEREVDDILVTVYEMLDTAEPSELKVSLGQFIDRIDISGKEMTINYWVAKPVNEIVPITGDLGGI